MSEMAPKRETEYTNKKELVSEMVGYFRERGVDMLDIERFLHDAIDALERERSPVQKTF